MTPLTSDTPFKPDTRVEHDRQSPDRESISLLTLAGTALGHRLTILRYALALFVVVALVGLLTPRTHTVSASFMPQARRAPSNLSGLAAQLGIGLPTEPGQSPSFYVDLLESRPVLAAVADSRYTFTADGRRVSGTLLEFYRIRATTAVLGREAVIKKLRNVVSPRLNQRTGVVTVEVTSRDPDLSVQICQRLLELLNSFNLETRQSQAAAERRFIEGRLQEVKQELRRAEDVLQTFLQRNRDDRNSPELRMQEDRLRREVTLQQQVYVTLSQSYEQARIEEVRDTPVITVLESPQARGRPDPRGLLTKGLLALLVGGLLGFIVAAWKDYLQDARRRQPDRFDRFALLRRHALDDLRHPWRPLKHLFAVPPKTRDPGAH